MISPVVIGILNRLPSGDTVEEIPLWILVVPLEVTSLKPPTIVGGIVVVHQGAIKDIGAVDGGLMQDRNQMLIVWMALKIVFKLPLRGGE